MQKNKFSLSLILLAAITFNMSSCDDDNDDSTEVTVTFEDVNLGTDGYWKGQNLIGKKDSTNSYGTTVHNYTGSFTSNSTNFYNTYTQEYSSWTGFSCSSLADSSVNGDYTHDMYLYGTTGANNSKKFAIAYSDSAYFTLSAVKSIKSVYVNNTTYTYKTIHDGNSYASAFKSGSYYCVKFTGYDVNGKMTGSATAYLADYRNGKNHIVKNWEKIDLSTLGKVKKVVLTFDSSDKGTYGINTPTYVAIDDVAFTD